MGRTSTRYKIRYQAEQIERYFGRIEDSAKFLDDLCEERSDVVNHTMPLFIAGLDVCRKLWDAIKAEL